jgi:hypothetical protein
MTSQDRSRLLAEIKKLNYKPNEWEKGFLGNILCHRVTSTKQDKILLNIYEKATGGGTYQNRQYGRRW